MAKAKMGDTVKVHYTGTLTDGTEFDSSKNRDPMEFKIGAGEVVPGFENMIVGMESGETKTSTISKDEAYGPYDPDRTYQIDRKKLPPDLEISVGQILEMRNQEGHSIPVRVMEVAEDTVTLDANHPLSGEDLTFTVELVEIV